MKRRDAGLVLANLALIATGLARAEGYPEKPLRMVVPYPPGASTDALGRIVAQKMAASTGQPVVVDNRSGASGNIGSELVAKAAGDPYTFLLGTDATHSSNMHMVANPPFNPIRDFTPLTLACMNPIVLVVHPSVPANSITELVAYVKANPNKGGYGSSGTGSPHHLAGELLKARTGAPFVHVPYRGGGPALNDLMGAQIPMLFASAITGTTRYEGLPNVPTVAETLEGFDMSSWLAFFGPPNIPEAATKRLSEEIVKALRDPETRDKLNASGLVVVAGTPAELGATVRRDFEARGKLIHEAGIKAE
jgi:tripartite-type tricarboxylate transporter receptor subunit TctC